MRSEGSSPLFSWAWHSQRSSSQSLLRSPVALRPLPARPASPHPRQRPSLPIERPAAASLLHQAGARDEPSSGSRRCRPLKPLCTAPAAAPSESPPPRRLPPAATRRRRRSPSCSLPSHPASLNPRRSTWTRARRTRSTGGWPWARSSWPTVSACSCSRGASREWLLAGSSTRAAYDALAGWLAGSWMGAGCGMAGRWVLGWLQEQPAGGSCSLTLSNRASHHSLGAASTS